jgi:hypothetical protein
LTDDRNPTIDRETTMDGLVHTGIAVRDLGSAMESVGAALGLTWATPQLRRVSAVWSGQPFDAEVMVAWSIEGPPHIELVQGGPATPWELTDDDVRLHHVAYWSGDLAADVARLSGAGYALELTGRGAAGAPSSFAYVKDPHGLRIELMDRAEMKAAFDAWLAGGALPQAVD